MDRTIQLLMLAVLIAVCSAGNGYNYIKPAENRGNIPSYVDRDGTTKSVYFFADPDDRRRVPQQRIVTTKQIVPQQRAVSYRQVTPQQRPVTYSQVTTQQRPISYNKVIQQQRPITYNQIAPQQIPITYNQIAPQQSPITYNQITAQQSPITYTQIAPQQRPTSYNQIVPQQLPFITNNQVIQQQRPIAYNQIVSQQQPTYTIQTPQQVPFFTTNQIAPTVKQNLQVVFVKTPGYEAYTNALLKMAQEAIQTQTIVYVLSKEPDIEELTRRFKEIQANARKMPEVRFIKYKTDDEAVRAQEAIQAQYESLPGPSNSFGTEIGKEIGAASSTETQTESIYPNYPPITTTNNQDDLHLESQQSFLPTGVDVVPGSSYLPPHQTSN